MASTGALIGTLASATPGFGQTQAGKRLKVGLTPPANQVTVGYRGQNADIGPLLPMYDCLVVADRFTGENKPGLATRWETSPDAKTWRFALRENVAFHDGSPFAAADVRFSWSLLTRQDSRATSAPFWRNLVASENDIEIAGPHEVVFHLKRPEPELPFYLTRSQGMLVYSKAYADKVGLDGYAAKPVGTGPFRFKEFKEGQYLLYERVENHWRKTPEFAELQLQYMPDDVTRLAALLAGEVHIAEVPRSIQAQAVARGMKSERSTRAAAVLFFAFGGNYLNAASGPLSNKLVRQAMNLAINRDEINDSLYGGGAEVAVVQPYQRSDPAFNPAWKPYPHDPQKARSLLAQAGYANGFDFDMTLVAPPGFPEFPTIVEAVATYFRNVGLRPRIVQMEIAQLVDLQRSRKLANTVNSNRNSMQPLFAYVPSYYASGGIGHFFESPFLEERIKRLQASSDSSERLELLKEVGNHLYEEFATMPILFLYGETLINPAVVAEYKADIGAFGASVDHEYTRPA
jgi:peptide/nickel transport system substrate-binding protein